MKDTKNKQKYRVIVAYLLLLTMMPFLSVKIFHIHKESSCIFHNESHLGSATSCAICLFTLSLFTEAKNFEYIYILTSITVERPIQKEKDVTVVLFFHPLRAPPCLPI